MNKSFWKRYSVVLWVMVTAIFSFMGGVWGVQAQEMWPFTERTNTAWEWGAQEKLIPIENQILADVKSKRIKQGEFLQMIVKVAKLPGEEGEVPAGAENHPSAPAYAAAKANGVIDCSCQIKPDGELSRREAAKFIMMTVNGRTNQSTLSLESVEGWFLNDSLAKRQPVNEQNISIEQAVDALYRMNQLLLQVGLSQQK
ncbi:hypothetical protein JNUCC42_17245 [Brevibacterium sp. JNUCC-42]|nr:hypothetical protein JNUCC42_17245 [Brevibacterium sp. JNUCC-42]